MRFLLLLTLVYSPLSYSIEVTAVNGAKCDLSLGWMLNEKGECVETEQRCAADETKPYLVAGQCKNESEAKAFLQTVRDAIASGAVAGGVGTVVSPSSAEQSPRPAPAERRREQRRAAAQTQVASAEVQVQTPNPAPAPDPAPARIVPQAESQNPAPDRTPGQEQTDAVQAQVVASQDSQDTSESKVSAQESLEDLRSNYKPDTCKWVEDMPRKVHRAPGCSRSGVQVCVGYVVCEQAKSEAKFVRTATCRPERCGEDDVVSCVNDELYTSVKAKDEDRNYMSERFMNLLSPGASRR